MHQITHLLDVFEWHCVGNQRADVDFVIHVPIRNFQYVSAFPSSTKGRAAPASAFNYDAGASVPQDDGKGALRIVDEKREGISMVNSCGCDLDSTSPALGPPLLRSPERLLQQKRQPYGIS